VLLLAIVLTACVTGQSDEAALASASRVLNQRAIDLPEFSQAFEEVSQECALFNGVEFEPSNVLGTVQTTSSNIDRAHLESEGSGMVVASTRSEATSPPAHNPATEIDAHTIRVMSQGPISTPTGRFGGGCFAWAEGQLNANDRFQRIVSLQLDYSDFIDEFADTSPALARANTKWAACMASRGYDGLRKPGDQMSAIIEKVEDLREGLVSKESALSFDIAISLANWDCFQPVSQEVASAWEKAHEEWFRLEDIAFLNSLGDST
jgi:hypothetical protein